MPRKTKKLFNHPETRKARPRVADSNPKAGVSYEELPTPVEVRKLPNATRIHGPQIGYDKYVDFTNRDDLSQLVGKRGQPTQYKTFFAPLAFQLCLLGATDLRLCTILNIEPEVFQSWRNPASPVYIPEFARALLAGREIADAEVAQSLYACAVGYSYKTEKIFYNAREDKVVRVEEVRYVEPDPNAAHNWLMNRQKGLWRAKIDDQTTQPASSMPPVLVINAVKVTRD